MRMLSSSSSINQKVYRTFGYLFTWIPIFWILFSAPSVTCPGIKPIIQEMLISKPVSSIANFSNVLPALRFRRNLKSDKLADIVTNMQVLARLANGVSLEIGLMDGSILSDDAIGELLHMGTLKPKDVINLSSTAIENAMIELDKLLNDMTTSDEITAIENRLVLLEDIRTASIAVDLANFTGKQEYKDELDDVVKVNSTSTDINSFKNVANQLEGSLNNFDEWQKEMNKKKADNALAILPSMRVYLENTADAAENFHDVLTEIVKVKTLKDKSKFIQLLFTENENRKRLNSLKYNDLTSVTGNIEKLNEAQEKLKKSRGFFQDIQKLIHSLDETHKQFFKYTAGFPGGRKDLEKLSIDSGNGWVSKNIKNSSIVTKSLRKAFVSFDDLNRILKNVESVWKMDESKRKEVETITSIQLKVISVADNSQTILTTIEEFKACDTERHNSAEDISEVEAIRQLITELDQKVFHALAYSNSLQYIDELKNLSAVKEIINIPNNIDDKVSFVKGVVGKMITEPKFHSLKETLKKVQTDLNNLLNLVSDITKLATKITNDFTAIEKYHKKLTIATYLGFYECVSKIGEKGSHVKTILKLVQSIRSIKKVENKVIKSIIGAQNDLRSVQSAAENMKKINAQEALTLKSSFQNSRAVAHNFGMAVQGLTNIKMAFDAKNQLNASMGYVDEITKSMDSANGLTQEHRASLQNFNSLKTSLSDMFTGIDVFLNWLDTFQETRKKRDSKTSDFESHGKIFDEASKIPEVKADLDSLLEAIKALDAQKFKEVIDTLDILRKMDLEFNKFDFNSAPSSLKSLDTFFASYSKSMATNPQSPTPSVLVPGQVVSTSWVTTTELTVTPKAGYSFWEIFGIVGGCIVGIGCVAGLIAFLYIQFFKKKPEPVSDSENPLSEELVLALAHEMVALISSNKSKGKVLPNEWANEMYLAANRIGKLNAENINFDENIAERRYRHLICEPKTMAKINGFPNNFINVSCIQIGPTIYFMAQAPMDGTEVEIDPRTNQPKQPIVKRISTCDKFLAMIDQNGLAIVAQLSNFEENGKKKCARYFSVEVGGIVESERYTVKTLDKKTNLEGFTDKKEYTLYTIEYTNKQTNAKKTVDILLYTGWPHTSAPEDPEPALEVIKFCDSYKTNVAFMCCSGCSRSATIVAIKFGIELCLKQKITNLTDILIPMRNARYQAVQHDYQISYMLLCITKGLMMKLNLLYLRSYDALYWYNNKIVNSEYEPTDEEKDENGKMKQEVRERKLKQDDEELEQFCKEQHDEYIEKMKTAEKKGKNKKSKKSGKKKSKETKNTQVDKGSKPEPKKDNDKNKKNSKNAPGNDKNGKKKK